MQKIKRNLLLAICLLTAIGMTASPPPEPKKGVVRVKLQSDLVSSARKAASQAKAGVPVQLGSRQIDEALSEIGGVSIRPVFPCPPGREAEHSKYGLDRWFEITFDETVNPMEARNILRQTPGIQHADAQVPMKLLENPTRYRVLDKQSTPAKTSTSMPFNDPRLPLQWHYNNDGSLNGAVPGADINLFKAWQLATGRNKVVVAIIDGGIDYSHEDLAASMWVNEAELHGQPGVDDDGDGYIDDIYGYNFCTYSGEIYPHSHGTHVAGTVGAINNNGIGVCGVAGGDGTPGSGVKLMSVQVFDPRSGSADGDFAAALVYAADKGATIAQCSWGWDGDGYYQQDVLDAVRYFTNTARSGNMTGGLCIFAAGNNGLEGQFYPGCMDEVIAVASMCYDLTPAPYSSHGDWIDVTAPGGNLDYDNAQGVLSTLPDNTYGYSEGTSMATPHVSGIAALILSKYGSESLINETVRQQIVTSVNDLYTANPKAEGKFGSGYVDAWKALQWGDGSAPQPVTDLKLQAAQDNVVLSWTIPASSDNNVNSHIIYYSESPFTAENTEGCKTVVVDTKFNISGDPFTYEIGGLSPLTTYYFAIVALDRWSNASPMSEVLSATTNEGPSMTVSRSAMSIKTTDGENWTSNTFDITNTASGLLKWNAYLRTLSSSVSNFSAAKGLMTVPYKGMLAGERYKAAAAPVTSLEAFQRDDFPCEITNRESLYAFIGDSDQTLPNSMAQLFTVDPAEYPDGFNLTHIFMQGAYGKNPVVEIYRNTGTLSNSTLLGKTEVKNESPYYSNLQLNESINFAPGESFYIVVHFPETTTPNYPLGMGVSNGSSASPHAYMSTDLGETWTLLTEVLKGSKYEEMASEAVWDITAKSLFPDWSQILTLSPSQGQLEGGSDAKQTVTVSHNGTKVPNGSYRARILFDTNETNPTNKGINVNISVEGNDPVVSFNKVLQFGNVLVGQKKTITVEVANTGYGSFAGGSTFSGIYGDKISCTSDQFEPPLYLINGIPSRSSEKFDITFAPTREGSHSGQVIIEDYKGHQLLINVQGAATDPAKIVADPQTIEVGELDAYAEGKDVSFMLKNEGNYPLQWVMPKFSNAQLDEISGSSTHKFGYSWGSNLYGAGQVEYSQAPEIVNPGDAVKQLGDYDYFSDPINIGFQFPFYGKTYEQLYISSLGMLTFDTYNEGTIYSPVSEENYTYLDGLGVISAYGFELSFSPKTRIDYGNYDGKFVVNFKDVQATVYAEETMPISFHIALSPSGDIEIGYDDYTAEKVFQSGKNIWVGVVDPDMEDPMTITSTNMSAESAYNDNPGEEYNRWKFINSGTAFRINAPRPDMIRSIAPTSGIIAPNESVEIKATVGATDEMYIGPTSTNLVIQSNDVSNPTYLVTFNADITGDLKAKFDLSAESIDFGKVFRTSDAQRSVSAQNHGRNYMKVTDVKVKGGKFSHNFTEAAEVAPGQSKDILVILPTEAEGEVSDILVITTSEGEKEVSLKGEVIGVPELKLSYESLDKTIPYGENVAVPLTLSNTGTEDLTFSITPGAHMAYKPQIEEGTEVSYKYTSSLDDPSAKREWYDIETTGLGEQYNYTYFIKKDIIPVELPFEFNFYGKNYNKMYIYDCGFVSFTERNDEGIWPTPPIDFPDGSIYNNLIAPYWGLHTMDITSTAGIYYYVNDTEAVVSFIEYGNSMNIGVDFQVVIRSDGTFTYNYKQAYDYGTIYAPFGVCGISDSNNEGIRLAERYLCFDTSVNFSPVVECRVAPGASAEADIKLYADDLAGDYSSKILVSTNVPTRQEVEIPVNIKVTGDPAPVFPEDFSVEQVAGYRSTDYADDLIGYYGCYWYVPLTIRNEGAAEFTIEKIDIESPKADGADIFPLYIYGPYADMMGMPTNGWAPYKDYSVNVGKSVVKLAIPVCDYENSAYAWQTPGTYDVKLTFHLSGVNGMETKSVNVKINVTEQPTIALDCDEIRVSNALDHQTEVRSLNIANTDGAYRLDYSVTVDPSGAGEEIESFALPAKVKGIPMSPIADAIDLNMPLLEEGSIDVAPRPAEVGVPETLYDAPSQEVFEYRRALYWPALESSTVVYNYGSGTTYSTYRASVAFQGPEEGFNISHIYMGIHPFQIPNKDVTIEIYGCDPQLGDEILGQGTYNTGTVDSQLYQNALVIAQLDRPVYISEGQDFWVVITYPVGQEYPATLIMKEESVQSNRYMGFVDTYGWFDVATIFSEQYGSLGYLVSCLETVEGGSWLKLLDADGNTSLTTAGEIGKGEKKEIRLQISPINASRESDNKAMLVIRSNDPKQPVINLPVYLDKNGSPKISVPKGIVSVDEGGKSSFEVIVTDPEGEDLVIESEENGNAATLVNAEAINGKGSVTISGDKMGAVSTGATDGVKLTYELAPRYLSSGTYSVTITAEDVNGNIGKGSVSYGVGHVNRAPIAIETDEILVVKGECSAPISFRSLFRDPDGEELTYSAAADDSGTVQLYTSENSLIIEGLLRGDAKVTVTATDPWGATTDNVLNVKVGTSGVDEIGVAEGISVYPNPVVETLYVATEGDFVCRVFAMNGSKMIEESHTNAHGAPVAIDVTSLSAGAYLVKVSTSEGKQINKILIKQ